MSIAVVSLLLIAALFVGYLIVEDHKRRAAALASSCFVCRAHVTPSGLADAYVCRRCGYDPSLGRQQQPALVDAIRTLRMALDHAKDAEAQLNSGAQDQANLQISNAMQCLRLAAVAVPDMELHSIGYPVVDVVGHSPEDYLGRTAGSGAEAVAGAISPVLGLVAKVTVKGHDLATNDTRGEFERAVANVLGVGGLVRELQSAEARLVRALVAALQLRYCQ